jgi:hypothetical protein
MDRSHDHIDDLCALEHVGPDAADLTVLSALADAGAPSVDVAGAFPLSRAADADRLSMGGGTRGKIVVLPAEGVG